MRSSTGSSYCPWTNARPGRFFLFYFKSLKIPLLPVRIPRLAMRMVLKIANRVLIGPLLGQDREAVEAEQEGYEKHWDAPPIEVNPVVRQFQEVTVRKWQEHLLRKAADGACLEAESVGAAS